MSRMRAQPNVPVARQEGVTQPSNRRILALVVPALGALAADPLLSLVDTAFVGRLGPVELAALGIDVAIFGFAFALFNFLAYATTPLVAAARGAGDFGRAGELVRQALYLAVVIGVISGAALAVLAPTLVSLFDPADAVQAPAVSYLRIRAMAVPALLIITAGNGAYRGFQDTRTPLIVILVINGINAVLDPVLMFGAGLGLDGAAVATVVAQGMGAVGFLVLLHRRSRAEAWPRGWVKLARAMPLLRVGGVLIVRTLLLVSSLAVATAAATRFGTESLAAHQIVTQFWFLLAMIVDALAIAAQAMVAELAGAEERSAARALSARLLRWGLCAGLVLGASLWLVGSRLGALFTDDAAVRAEVAVAVGIAAIMQPAAAVVFVADGVYMAMVGVRWLAVSTAAGFLAMLAGSVLAVRMDWGLAGVWWAITAMVVARGLVLASGYPRLFASAGVSG